MRIIRAIFVAAFHDGTGLKLSEGYFESTDVNLRNCFNGITRSLGLLVKMEALIVKCNRNHNYSIGEDLAKATLELIYIKNTSGLTLEKYLAQAHLLERKLTLFQERVLSNLDQHSRSAKQIASILSNYCQLVIDSPPTNQMSLIPCVVVTKEELFETAMKSIPS